MDEHETLTMIAYSLSHMAVIDYIFGFPLWKDNYTDIEHRSIAYFNVLFAFYFASTHSSPISPSPPLLPVQNQ